MRRLSLILFLIAATAMSASATWRFADLTRPNMIWPASTVNPNDGPFASCVAWGDLNNDGARTCLSVAPKAQTASSILIAAAGVSTIKPASGISRFWKMSNPRSLSITIKTDYSIFSASPIIRSPWNSIVKARTRECARCRLILMMVMRPT